MNISLTPELEELVVQKVASGMYHSASEVIREGLRLLKEQDEIKQIRLKELRHEIGRAVDQADRGEVIPAEEVFQSLSTTNTPKMEAPDPLPLGHFQTKIPKHSLSQGCPFPVCKTADEILAVAVKGEAKGWLVQNAKGTKGSRAIGSLRLPTADEGGIVVLERRDGGKEIIAAYKATTGDWDSRLWFITPEHPEARGLSFMEEDKRHREAARAEKQMVADAAKNLNRSSRTTARW